MRQPDPEPGRIATCQAVLFQRFVQEASKALESGKEHLALEWCAAASWFASRKGWFGLLGSRELEGVLLSIAQKLPPARVKTKRGGKPCWLHVFNEAYGTLGHTNLCRRWIDLDSEVIHDAIVVDQRSGSPERLLHSVAQSGGRAALLDPGKPILERADELRTYACQHADVVVLHTHPEDVFATIAFGVPGGPPVLFVNHADHQFWVGHAVADLVLDIRDSGHRWTRENRGVPRSAILPLPLEGSDSKQPTDDLDAGQQRLLRRQLGLPEEGVLLLTVGSAAKFNPLGELNFFIAAGKVLSQCPSATLVAVGPEKDGRWRQLAESTGGRVLALGRQADARPFCRAADLYLEGFPAGSLTALLEAGESGLACVRAPALCRPPFASDSPGLDVIIQPADLADYVRTVLDLVNDPGARAALGQKLQVSIRNYHCGANWLARLSELRQLIPTVHSVSPGFTPVPVDAARRDWLAAYLHAGEKEITRKSLAAYAFVAAWQRTSASPQADLKLWVQIEEILAGSAGDRIPNVGWRQRLSLRRFNREVRSKGGRSRILSRADFAFRAGQRSVARQHAYDCLGRYASSILDVEWLKIMAKTHLSSNHLSGLRRFQDR